MTEHCVLGGKTHGAEARGEATMGLASKFKEFIAQRMPEALDAGQACGDICFLDALCSMHSFRPSAACGGEAPLDQLASHLIAAVAPMCLEGSTLVVCFDRQATTPAQKYGTQAKRRKANREWSAADAEAMLQRRELPFGDDWADFLAARHVRALVIAAVAAEVLARFAAGGVKRASRLIVHNGRVQGGAQVALVGQAWTEAAEGCPEAGEADVAMGAWARHLLAERPDASVATLTIDTDIVLIMAIHGGSRSSVCLNHSKPMHRMCVHTAVLAARVQALYGLRLEEFVVVAISKSTDFSPACIRGIPAWEDTLRWSGAFLKQHHITMVADGVLDIAAFMRLMHGIAMNKPAAKVAELTQKNKQDIAWTARYWLCLEE